MKNVLCQRHIRCSVLCIAVLLLTCPAALAGRNATRGRYPYVVSLQGGTLASSHFCGGVLISKDWVLTAAWCAQKLMTIKKPVLYVGAYDRIEPDEAVQVRGFAKAVMHPNWDGTLVSSYNMALVLLDEPSTNTVVPLPANDTTVIDAGQKLSAIGWGPDTSGFFKMRPQNLQEAELIFLANDNCQTGYDALYQQLGCDKTLITEQMLCAWGGNGVDACKGLCEPGGPLLLVDPDARTVATGDPSKDAVVGIASFVRKSCAEDAPFIYIGVSMLSGWITETQGLDLQAIEVPKTADHFGETEILVTSVVVGGSIVTSLVMLLYCKRRSQGWCPASLTDGKDWDYEMKDKGISGCSRENLTASTSQTTETTSMDPFVRNRHEIQRKWHTEQYPFFVLEKWKEGLVNVYENQVLGCGASSIARKGMWDGLEVAVKFSEASTLQREALVLEEVRNLKHKNIVKIYGVNPSVESRGRYCSFIVMELMSCSLRQVLQDPLCVMSLTYRQIVRILYEIAEGLAALHSLQRPVTHGDVKPGNVLLAVKKLGVEIDIVAKLSDFDCSRQRNADIVSNRFIGTRKYIAPELYWSYQESHVNGEKLDVYALGVVMWDCLEDGENGVDDAALPFMDTYYPPALVELMRNCMEKERHKRSNLEDILSQLRELMEAADQEWPWSSKKVRRKLADIIEYLHSGGQSLSNDENMTAFNYCKMQYIDFLQIFKAIAQELKNMSGATGGPNILDAGKMFLERNGKGYNALIHGEPLSGSDAVNNANRSITSTPGGVIGALGGLMWKTLSGVDYLDMSTDQMLEEHPGELTQFVLNLCKWECSGSLPHRLEEYDMVINELAGFYSMDWAAAPLRCQNHKCSAAAGGSTES